LKFYVCFKSKQAVRILNIISKKLACNLLHEQREREKQGERNK